MAEQEFLASFGVEIDESGVARLQTALEENRTLAEELAAAFDAARASVQAFFASLGEISLPGVGNREAQSAEDSLGMNIPISLDFTKANKELTAFLKEATKAFKLAADGSGIVSAGKNALSSLQSIFASTVLPLKVQIQTSGSGADSVSGAAGTAAQAGIAGVASAVESILNVSNVTAPVTNNSTRTVSAPVSINVTAAGSNPEAVGQSVYNVAEQYLLRTLGGD